MRTWLTTVAIAAAVVILAALSLFALTAERPGPAPGASPTTTATPAAAASLSPSNPSTTASAPASPSPTAAAATDRYGYVLTTGGEGEERIFVRRERDFASAFELRGVAPAVSADGKRLAYWRTTPGVGATDLRVLEVADPTSDRSVLTLTGQTLGGGLVWSNDGLGLLLATYSRERTVGSGPESCPSQSFLLMLDLATTPATTRSAGSGGCALLPVAWDRPGRAAAAVITGPGGYATEYLTWNGNAASPISRAPVPRLVSADSVQASSDAKLVMGLEDNRNVLRVWPLLDITKADHVRHPSLIRSAVWRPGPTAPYEVFWAVGQKVDLFRYQTDSSTTLYTTTDNVAIAAARPDGSGVLLTLSNVQQPPPLATRLVLVDAATRQATDVWTTAGGVHSLSRGVLLR